MEDVLNVPKDNFTTVQLLHVLSLSLVGQVVLIVFHYVSQIKSKSMGSANVIKIV